MSARRLDAIDLKILAELQRDGRITYQRLSELVGLSPRPCLERVRRLERDGILLNYTVRVDLRKLADVVLGVCADLTRQAGQGSARHVRAAHAQAP